MLDIKVFSQQIVYSYCLDGGNHKCVLTVIVFTEIQKLPSFYHREIFSRCSFCLEKNHTTRKNGHFWIEDGFHGMRGWSGGAMVLGKLPVPGRPTIRI